MVDKDKITKWLKDNYPELSWNRTSGDGPQIKIDADFINRSEGYEIRDLIYKYYTHCNLGFNDKNFETTYKKIVNYKKSQKVKRDEMLEYLINGNKKCKDS